MLMTEHNLWFYQRLMQELREAIAEGRLAAYAEAFRARYRQRIRKAGGSPHRRRSARGPAPGRRTRGAIEGFEA